MNARNSMVIVPKAKPFALASRRFVAWGLEVGLVVMGAAIPWSLGNYVLTAEKKAAPVVETENLSTNDEFSQINLIPLNPVLETVQRGWARMAQIPPHQLYRQVPRWTDILWTVAFVLPIGVAGGQLMQLSRSGSTGPKRWLGVQVFSMVGGTLLLRQVVARELLRWGVPVGLVGGAVLITGASFGIWTPAVVGLLALVEGISAISPDNRAWHDRIARTRVAIAVPEAPTPVEPKGVSHGDLSITRMTGNSTLLEQDSQLRLYGE
ncbi:MAG: RDD family protein, partial [Cyanobacteria bacterium P01_D01_bin.56]